MAILKGSIAVGDQTPAVPQNVGGGLIVAIKLLDGGQSTNYNLEDSDDGGTTWGAVCDEAGNAIVLVYTAENMHQINPPVRAPLFRLNGDTNESGAAFKYNVHTV
jgi:hypothetical protein